MPAMPWDLCSSLASDGTEMSSLCSLASCLPKTSGIRSVVTHDIESEPELRVRQPMHLEDFVAVRLNAYQEDWLG